MKLTKAPIGMFDSGLGGLTLLKEVRSLLPREDIIYFGDLIHVPYGDRSLEEIEIFANDIISWLRFCGVKAILIACNTSSAILLDKTFNGITVQNLIPSGISAALEVTRNYKIGMIANPGTCASGAHESTLMKENQHAEFFAMPCPKLVPLIESGEFNGQMMDEALSEYLPPLIRNGIDTLILGCTHYPLAFNAIRRNLPASIAIVDPAQETVLSLRQKLMRQNLVRREPGIPRYEFVTSSYKDDFKNIVMNYLGLQELDYRVVNLWQTEHTIETQSQTFNAI
jgi:glutamate racemase